MHAAEPATSPDSLTGATTPIVLASVNDGSAYRFHFESAQRVFTFVTPSGLPTAMRLFSTLYPRNGYWIVSDTIL